MAISRARRKSSFGAEEHPLITVNPEDLTVYAALSGGDSARTTIRAKDPEGFNMVYDINYMHDSSRKFYSNDSGNLPPHLLHPARITTGAADSAGYTTATYRFITRSQTYQDSDGSGNSLVSYLKNRFTVSDGIHTSSIVKQLEIKFSVNLVFDTSASEFSNYNGTNINSFTASIGTGGKAGPRLQTGKRYMEVWTTGTTPGVSLMFGFVREDQVGSWSGTHHISIYEHSNRFYGTVGNEYGAFGGDMADCKIGMAWDTTAKKVWFSRNGTWASGGDPGAGGAGMNMPAGSYDDGTNFLCMGFTTGGHNNQAMLATVKLGNDTAYAIPSGFSSQ